MKVFRGVESFVCASLDYIFMAKGEPTNFTCIYQVQDICFSFFFLFWIFLPADTHTHKNGHLPRHAHTHFFSLPFLSYSVVVPVLPPPPLPPPSRPNKAAR